MRKNRRKSIRRVLAVLLCFCMLLPCGVVTTGAEEGVAAFSEETANPAQTDAGASDSGGAGANSKEAEANPIETGNSSGEAEISPTEAENSSGEAETNPAENGAGSGDPCASPMTATQV